MISNSKFDELFSEFGCIKKQLPDGTICYFKDDVLYRISYVEKLNSYILETADDYNDAEKNNFEDDEIYNAELDEEKIIMNIKYDLENLF